MRKTSTIMLSEVHRFLPLHENDHKSQSVIAIKVRPNGDDRSKSPLQNFDENGDVMVDRGLTNERNKEDIFFLDDNYEKLGMCSRRKRVLKGFLLHRSSINNSASLSKKFGESYFIFKFGISGLLHQVVTPIADRIRDVCLRQELLEYMVVHVNDASESSKPSWGKTCTLRNIIVMAHPLSPDHATDVPKVELVQPELAPAVPELVPLAPKHVLPDGDEDLEEEEPEEEEDPEEDP
ncbi:hypothetical protein Tco_1337935 [Tanacetum coccineum]